MLLFLLLFDVIVFVVVWMQSDRVIGSVFYLFSFVFCVVFECGCEV